MPFKLVFLKPHNWSRSKPHHQSTTTAVKGIPSLGRDIVELKKHYVLGLLICEILADASLQDWVGW